MAKIVIADDASFMRSSLKFIMEKGGHEVVGTAENGAQAAELYKQLKPDLITLDILMKGGDGLTALKTIKQANPRAKVIMITALGAEDKQKEARDMGASGYIKKPFKADEVGAEVTKVLA